MTLKSYLWGIRTVNLFSLIALAIVIYFIDPLSSGLVGISLFYLILFIVLSGIFNLILIWFRKMSLGQEVALSTLSLSFRQGILMAILMIILLIIQSQRILFWWSGLLSIAGVFLLELWLLSKESER